MKRLTELRKFSAAALALAMLLASGCGSSVTASPSTEPSAEPTEDPDPTVIVIPAPEGENFGLVAEEYDLLGGTPTAITVGNVTGDTDVLDFKTIRCRYDDLDVVGIEHASTLFELVFDAGIKAAFTAEKWEDGKTVEDEASADVKSIDRDGYVEKYSGGGKWERYSRASLKSSELLSPRGTTPEPVDAVLTTLGSEGEVCAALPLGEPGIYRYTLYFRESIDNTAEHCTTGDELYSISFEVTIPKSDRDFDLLAVTGKLIDSEAYGEKGICQLAMSIRLNYGDTQTEWRHFGYLPGERGRLEIFRDGEWQEVENGLLQFEHKMPTLHDISNEYFTVTEIYPPEPEGRYRLTLSFEEGSREYDLVLYVRLGEGTGA